jgi:hypothetical protein
MHASRKLSGNTEQMGCRMGVKADDINLTQDACDGITEGNGRQSRLPESQNEGIERGARTCHADGLNELPAHLDHLAGDARRRKPGCHRTNMNAIDNIYVVWRVRRVIEGREGKDDWKQPPEENAMADLIGTG